MHCYWKASYNHNSCRIFLHLSKNFITSQVDMRLSLPLEMQLWYNIPNTLSYHFIALACINPFCCYAGELIPPCPRIHWFGLARTTREGITPSITVCWPILRIWAKAGDITHIPGPRKQTTKGALSCIFGFYPCTTWRVCDRGELCLIWQYYFTNTTFSICIAKDAK